MRDHWRQIMKPVGVVESIGKTHESVESRRGLDSKRPQMGVVESIERLMSLL